MREIPVPEVLTAVIAQWQAAGSPPRQPTKWYPNTWRRWLPSHQELFDSLPATLDRDAVTVLARGIDGPAAAVRAYIAAMVWGYGPDGRGAYRTDRVLKSNPDASERLFDVAEAVRERGPLAGFDVFAAAPLKHLGVAFSTKYLYYCSRAVSHHHGGRTAPILDSVMSRWMRRHVGISFALTHDRDSYGRYVALLEQWGTELRLPADVVEERIYVSALAPRSSDAHVRKHAAENRALKALRQLTTALAALDLAEDARTELQSLEQLLGVPSST